MFESHIIKKMDALSNKALAFNSAPDDYRRRAQRSQVVIDIRVKETVAIKTEI